MRASTDTELMGCCDSDFERDVLSRLLKLGYRVTPQVAVGGYRIDLVVEGAEDQRLAIKLDGDQYHTPDRWADDLARQRVLERVGWKCWRCWGSSFTTDPEGCMDDLVAMLADMGIRPVAGPRVPNIYTERRVVGGGPEPQVGDGEAQATQLELVSEADDTPSFEPIRSTPEPEIFEELTVLVGDHVLISYNDEPTRQYTLLLDPVAHDPSNFVINANKPLAQALIGHAEEEVVIPAGGGERTVTIMKIGRGVPSATAQAAVGT